MNADEYTYVPLHNELLVALVERYGAVYAGHVDHAVESFLERTEDDWQPRNLYAGEGHTWGQLHLPEGTQLRTRYLGEWAVAEIKGGKVVYNGEAFSSPAKACNTMRGNTSNNAWVTLEVKRPQDQSFRLADRFRR